MPPAPQPVPLRPIMPPELPPTVAPFITRLEVPEVPLSLKNITNSDRWVTQVKTHVCETTSMHIIRI